MTEVRGHGRMLRKEDRRFVRGKGRFIPAQQTAPAAELPDETYPLILNTGRLLYHWHGGTITRRVAGLLALAPDLEVAIHPADAARLGIARGLDVDRPAWTEAYYRVARRGP